MRLLFFFCYTLIILGIYFVTVKVKAGTIVPKVNMLKKCFNNVYKKKKKLGRHNATPKFSKSDLCLQRDWKSRPTRILWNTSEQSQTEVSTWKELRGRRYVVRMRSKLKANKLERKTNKTLKLILLGLRELTLGILPCKNVKAPLWKTTYCKDSLKIYIISGINIKIIIKILVNT